MGNVIALYLASQCQFIGFTINRSLYTVMYSLLYHIHYMFRLIFAAIIRKFHNYIKGKLWVLIMELTRSTLLVHRILRCLLVF